MINGCSLIKSILGAANATVIHIFRLCVFFVHKESSTQLSFLKRSIEIGRLAESFFPKSSDLLKASQFQEDFLSSSILPKMDKKLDLTTKGQLFLKQNCFKIY